MKEGREIVYALIEGVRKATPPGGTEQDVTTVVTRPLWRMWNRLMGDPEDDAPTEYIVSHNVRRIFGSETIVIESEKFEAYSFSRNRQNTVDSPPSL